MFFPEINLFQTFVCNLRQSCLIGGFLRVGAGEGKFCCA